MNEELKKEIEIKESWIKLSNKEICKEFGIKSTIEAGLSGGYLYNLNYQVIKGEVFMKKKIYDKTYKKK